MRTSTRLKKPGFKLVKLDLNYKDNKIIDIEIKGDFFLYPEEAIEELEKELIGEKIEKEKLDRKIDNFFDKNDITPYGINSEIIVEAILNCLKNWTWK